MVGYIHSNSAVLSEANLMELELVNKLAETFRKAKLSHTDVMLVIEDKAKHHESAWARRFPGTSRIFIQGERI